MDSSKERTTGVQPNVFPQNESPEQGNVIETIRTPKVCRMNLKNEDKSRFSQSSKQNMNNPTGAFAKDELPAAHAYLT